MKRTERQQLAAAINDIRSWAAIARSVRHIGAHFPISGRVALQRDEDSLLSLVEQAATTDPDAATPLTKVSWFDGRKKLQPAHEAASRLSSLRAELASSGRDEVLAKVRYAYAESAEQERERLLSVLADLERSRSLAVKALEDATHMPITRTGVLAEAETTTLESLVSIFDLHQAGAANLLDRGFCVGGDCEEAHTSAAVLAAVHAEAEATGVPAEVRSLASSVSSRLQVEQVGVKKLFVQVSEWPKRVDEIRKARTNAPDVITQRVSVMLQGAAPLALGPTSLQLLPITREDQAVLANLKLLRDSPLTAADQKLLTQAEQTAASFVAAAKAAFTSRWDCTRDGRCVEAHSIVPIVHTKAQDVQAHIDRLNTTVPVSRADMDGLLDPTLGFMKYVSRGLHSPELLNAAMTDRARAGVAAIANAGKAAKAAAAAAKSAADIVRATDVAAALQAMDLDVLRKASPDRIRVAPLTNADLNTVWDVLKFDEKYYLEQLPGLGEASARSIAQAALRLFEGVRDETPVRIDVKRRSKRTSELLEALREWDAARRFEPTKDEVAVAKSLIDLFKAKTAPTHILAMISGTARADQPLVGDLLVDALGRSARAVDGDVWKDFLSRPADYFGMLTELGFVTEDEANMHGDLPEEIVEAVRAKELKRDYLTASLRAYQSFGSRFALVQKKVVIGDEMGLGKTVEALAVLAHLRSRGQAHFIVVCPAAVVSNWVRETSKHTRLSPFRLHGPQWERNYAAKSWLRRGGVAVTTYDLLSWAKDYLAQTEVGCAIFDEAHYIKNPLAKRSQAAQDVIHSLKYALLMTGTPLENSVQEFRNLIGYIRPDLSDSAPEYLPSKFRKHVAPAYLRRNQEDVLTELPELVEIDEWMGMSAADERAYREAVREGHFMLMRRTAMLSEHSMKVERLIEIVEEAEANDRRVIVFSYFRDVLEEVARLLPGAVFGPLTGSLPAVERQRLIDRFSSAGGGAVLVAQITAGGVGLNIQSASVVVICEPQLKPTTEAQAIARAHRMGQTNTVQVHRLLTENSVDDRIREILAEKRQLFDEFARDSVIAKQAPDAVDVSDAELARLVIAAERERLFGQAASASD